MGPYFENNEWEFFFCLSEFMVFTHVGPRQPSVWEIKIWSREMKRERLRLYLFHDTQDVDF